MIENILIGLNNVLSLQNILAFSEDDSRPFCRSHARAFSHHGHRLVAAADLQHGTSNRHQYACIALSGSHVWWVHCRYSSAYTGDTGGGGDDHGWLSLAAQGKAGKALGVSLVFVLHRRTISAVGLMTIAPTLGMIVLEFGPVEMFSVAVLGITIIASLSQGSTIRGLFSGGLGLLLAMVGMDVTTGTPRFTYGMLNLFEGVPFTVALIGLFSIPQVIRLIQATSRPRS